MKADWIKRNIVTVLFAVAFLALLGYSSWRLQQTIARRREVTAQLKAELEKFTSLRGEKTFPSSENLNILRADTTRLDEVYHRLVSSLRHTVIIPLHSQEDLAVTLAQKLTEMTAKARRAGVETPDRFAFGFDSYLGVLPPAQPEALRLLAKELVVVEALVDVLLVSKVEQISRIRRVAVGGTTGPDTLDEASPTNSKALYQTTPFELRFVATTESLQSLVNHLNEMPWLFIVRTVGIDSEAVTVTTPGVSRGGAPAVNRATSPRSDRVPGPPTPPIPPGFAGGGALPPPGAPGMGSLPAPPAPFGGQPAPAASTPESTTVAPAEPVLRNHLIVTMLLDLVELREEPPAPTRTKPEKPPKP